MPYFAIINLRTVLRLVSILASRAYGSISIVCGSGGIPHTRTLKCPRCVATSNLWYPPVLKAGEEVLTTKIHTQAHARMAETRPFFLLPLFGPGNEAKIGYIADKCLC